MYVFIGIVNVWVFLINLMIYFTYHFVDGISTDKNTIISTTNPKGLNYGEPHRWYNS